MDVRLPGCKRQTQHTQEQYKEEQQACDEY